MSLLFYYYFIEKRVGTLRVEDFIAIHDCNKILGVRKIDDVVGIARKHDDALNLVTTYFVFKNLNIWVVLITKLNKPMTTYYNELLPLSVMPVLPLGNSGFADVDTHLPTVQGME